MTVELTDEEQAQLTELDEQLTKFEGQKRWSDVIKTIIAKSDIVHDAAEKADLLRQAGSLYVERSSNQAEAINCFEKVLELEPADVESMTRLREMYEKRRDWEKLIGIMEREALLLDEADRPYRYVEMAQLATQRIRKPDVCIGLWEKVLENDATNPEALEALAQLYERAREWPKLAGVLETLTDADPDPKMLTKLGSIYADKVGDDEGAVRAFKRLLTLDPDDRRAQEQLKRRYVALKAWDELEDFYGASGKWDELIRILEREADSKEIEQEDRIALLFRAAKLWIERNDKPERAARAYEKVLDADDTNLEAAEALSPIYEAAGDARKLVRVYEVRLVHDMDDNAKVALMREAGLLYEERLRSPNEAFDKYLEAFAVMPSQEVVREDVERMAQATGDWTKVVTTYQSAIENAGDDDAIELRMNLGAVFRRVEKVDEAIEQYRVVYDARPEHREAISALAELYEQTEKYDELMGVFERRMELEEDPEQRRQTAYQRASLMESQLEDPGRAIQAYNDILGEYGHEEVDAFRALDTLYESEGRFEDLAATLERRIELGPESDEELASLKFRLGLAMERNLGDKVRAVGLYREVLTLLPEHDGAREALEQLLTDDDVGVDAARILEPIYESQSNWEMLIKALKVLHNGTSDPEEQLELMTKVAQVQGEHMGDGASAFNAYAQALRAAPGSEDTLARLEMLAISQESFPQLVALVQELATQSDNADLARSLWIKAAEIQDTQLEDVEGAVAAYRKVLDEDPSDQEVLQALEQLFRRTERWKDLVGVLRRRVEQTFDVQEKEELLSQMATIQDQFLEDPAGAVSVYREVLELDPTSQLALGSLDDLFARQEMWTELADNVERQLELSSDPEQQIELMLRSAQLRETRMNATEAAVEIYREVLHREQTNVVALSSLERLLEQEDQQVVIAEILEPIYRDSNDVRKLIGVHEIQARHASAPERRVDLLHRIAELYELSLEDYANSFETYSRALGHDPANIQTQEQLERLTPMLGDAEGLARTYEEQVAEVDDPILAASLHVKAAQIREMQMGDHDAAIKHYQRVLVLDDQHLEAATALERLYQLNERYEDLAQIYLRKSTMVVVPEDQKEHLYRAAAIYEDLLERPEEAIKVYHSALEIDNEDLQSLDKLIELNLRLEKPERLLEVYHQKAEIVDDPEEKKRIFIEVGAVYEREIGDNEKAIDSYQRILEIDPDELMALQRLDALYQATENWEELQSVLEREADLASDPSEVISYRYRIAELWHQRTGDPLRAVDIYRDILDVAPDHEPTLQALESMVSGGTEPLAAASVLEPVYRSTGEWAKLIAVNEVQVSHEEDPLRKVELLHGIADLYEMQLDDGNKSFDAYARSLPFDNRHDQTLGSLERLAEYVGRWDDVTRLYDVEIEKIKEDRPDDVVDMALRTAQIYEVQSGNVDAAIQRYSLVAEADPSHVQSIEALDRLYEATERWAELADVLVKEIDIAPSPDAVLDIQFRLGQVRQNHLGDVDGAIGQYQEILAAAPEHSPSMSALEFLFADGVRPLVVGEILEPIYRMQESWDRLLNVHEMQLNYQPDTHERVTMMHRIAEIAEDRAADHERAFVWMQRALLEDPSHDHTLGEVERLGELLDGWPQLANTYADALEGAEGAEQRTLVGKRLARVFEVELGDIAKAEEAYRFVVGSGSPDDETLEALDRIYVQNGAHEALASVLTKRLEISDIPQDQVDISYRLGQVLANDLGRTDEAINVYQSVLTDLEPEHTESIKALQDIYTRMGAWDALSTAFDKELEAAFGDTNQSEILGKMARLASEQQGDPDKAQDLWRRVLDMRGEDHEALNALGNIYASQERWGDLVEILDREVSVCDSDTVRVQIYADLGRIWYEKLDRSRNALDNWERVLDIDPTATGALFHMAEIHRAQNATTDLVDTLHRVIDVGAATLEDAEIEAVYMQLGGLYRTELQQPVDAVDSYENALQVNPRNMDAINAIEEIHTAEGMWEDVIGAMEKRVVAFETPEEKVAQLVAIAGAWSEKVENADGGTSAYQRVLEMQPSNAGAFEKLETLHTSAARWEDLIDMYLTRYDEAESIDEGVKLLRSAAKVFEEKLDSPEQAYDTLEAAWSLDFKNKATWMELERVTRVSGKWNDLLTSAQNALAQEEDPTVKIALCLQCARWYGQELGHPEYALEYYRQIRELDPDNVEVMVSAADLYEATQQYDEFAQTLGLIVQRSDSPETIADTYVRMGKLSKGHLNQPEQAPGYYRKALDAFPSHLPAIEALEKVYVQSGDDDRLLDILQRKTRIIEDPEQATAAKLQLAEFYEVRMSDTERAIETYQQVREADPVCMPALKGLERLYALTERWQDLLAVLEAQLELVTSERERVEILLQLAGMWEEQFLKPEQAAERLEQLVEIDPTHSDALNGLARLYRAQLRWDDVIETYERHVSATPDRAEKIQIYKSLGETYAGDLDDADRAVDAYLNVLSIDENDVEALDALTRIYDKRGDHVSALEMMEQLARLVEDPAHQVDLLYRAGRILDEELGDRASALDKYQMAVDLDPGHLQSLASMRSINLDAGDYLAAAKLLEQEAQYQQSPRIVAERLVELGRVYEERLDEHDRAIATFEAALKQDPDNEEAAMPLMDEYVKLERFEEAFPLLEMLVKRSGKRENDEQHRLAFALGETSMKLGRTEDAIKAFEKAYQVDSTHLPTLLGVAGAHYAAQEWAKSFKFYQMLLVHHRDALAPDEIVDIFYRLGVVKREQNERRKSLNMFDKALEEDPNHLPTLEAVVGLYESQQEWQQVIHFTKQILETTDDYDERFKLLDRVGDLWKDKLGNAAKAIESYQEASDLRPEDHKMLHKLLMAYQETKQWEQAIEVIENISALDDRKSVKAKYAYTIAVVMRDELKDADRALDKFGVSLDLDHSQLKAFEAINKILNAKKDWKGLERAYRKMIFRIIEEPGQEDLKFNLFHQLGIIFRDRQKNFEAAAEAFKMSTTFRPDSAQQHQILAELFAAMPERTADAIEEHQWLLRQDPYRVDSYRALYKLYFDQRAYDKAWCLASTLSFLNKADNEQQQFYAQYKPQGPIKPRGRVERAHWFNDLMHPNEDRYVSKIMELMAPSVLAVKQASDKALNIHKLKPVDPASSTVALARTFGFALQVLNIPTQPRLFLQQQTTGGLAHIPGSNAPAVIAGGTLLSGYNPIDLMFICGRFLSYYLSEHFVRTIFSSHTELRMLLLAALRISGMGPADPQVDQWAASLKTHMTPAAQDGLRSVCRKFIDAGGSTDIKSWIQNVELTGVRAGFLICNDLDTARRMLQAIPPEGSVDLPAKDKLKELVLFSVSESYFRLREALGIQIQV